jgi:hypothetical protein
VREKDKLGKSSWIELALAHSLAFPQESEINNLKSSENLAIIYIESEREK